MEHHENSKTVRAPAGRSPETGIRRATGPGTALQVVCWQDPVVDALGSDPRSPYVEQFWLPHLGPTAAWLLRRFALRFDAAPDGFTIDVRDAARSIGVGAGQGTSGPFHRTVDRLVRFGIAQRLGTDRLAVRRRLPPLTHHQVAKLPPRLQRAHERWLADQRRRRDHPGHGGHATRLAQSLLAVGATRSEAIEQLARWNFDAPAAERAVRAALEQHEAARAPT